MSFLIKDEPVGRLNALVKKLGGLDVMGGILDNTVEFTVTARVREFLRPAGEFTLPAATELFDPTAYFHSRNGMDVWYNFIGDILEVAKSSASFAGATVGMFDLVKRVRREEMRSELPKNHVFEDASEFCFLLAKMIDQQPDGEEGSLLTDRRSNVFYVRGVLGLVFEVTVWRDVVIDMGIAQWTVFSCQAHPDMWHEDYRVFCTTA